MRSDSESSISSIATKTSLNAGRSGIKLHAFGVLRTSTRENSRVLTHPSAATWPRWQVALVAGALAVLLSSAIYDVVIDRDVPAAWGFIAAGGMLITIDGTRKNTRSISLTRQLQIGLTALFGWILAFPTAFVLSRDHQMHHFARTTVFFALPLALSLATIYVLSRIRRS